MHSLSLPRRLWLGIALSCAVVTPAWAAPGQPTLVSPAGELTGSTMVFSWNAVPASEWYVLWVGSTVQAELQQWYSAEQAGCASGGTCSANLTLGLAPGPYFWFVAAYNSTGLGPWSASKAFSVEESDADVEPEAVERPAVHARLQWIGCPRQRNRPRLGTDSLGREHRLREPGLPVQPGLTRRPPRVARALRRRADLGVGAGNHSRWTDGALQSRQSVYVLDRDGLWRQRSHCRRLIRSFHPPGTQGEFEAALVREGQRQRAGGVSRARCESRPERAASG